MHDWPLILKTHSETVWRTAYRLLGSEADAADCFQETFLAVVQVAHGKEVRNWSALLRRIATARALDRLRVRFRHDGRNEAAPDWDAVASSEPGPVQQAMTQEMTGRIRELLAGLPPREAQVFCLRFIEDMANEEITDQLGLTPNAVGVLLHKARRRLREMLNRHDESNGSRT